MSRSANRGFTLVEVLVAAAILALIISIIYSAFAGSIKTMEISTEGGEVYRKARVVLYRMAQEISCAYLLTEQEGAEVGTSAFIGEDREREGLPADTLWFTSTALPLGGRCRGLKQIGFYVDVDPETEKPVLMMREDTMADDPNAHGVKSVPLGEGISGIDFTYYDSQGREWKRWDTTMPLFAKHLPRRVKIALFFKDERDEPLVLTTTALVFAGGAGGES
jgi:prepilin-type N-terminal cleavage/methylation domain-containing protein